MIFSASSTASANDWVSTGKPLGLGATQGRTRVLAHVNGGLRGPAVRGDPEARQVVERHGRLVGAHVPGVRDPPLTVIAARVAVFIERRAGDHHAVLGRDDRVLEGPGAGGR